MKVTKEAANKIKVIVMDVDGTLTDGKIYMGADGEVMKAFSIKDGYAVVRFGEMGITPAIITGRTSKIVEMRCKELKVKHLYQDIHNKIRKLEELLDLLSAESGEEYNFENVAYAGDDLIDFECMKKCGIAVCPADAVDEIKEISHFVSSKNGGDGAVREFYDLLKKLRA